MAATYSAVGLDADNQPLREGDTSYESFRHGAHVNEKQAHGMSFQLPSNFSAPFQELSSKIRHGNSYRQIQSSSKRLWNSGWLSTLSFLIFAVWFMLLIGATAALFLYSSRNSGIAGQSYTYRYSWTYGPTAVLALTLSLWSHVEYWCKELTPWARMRKAPTSSRDGLLGDYFSKWPQVVLWDAIKEGDHAVWLSALGSFLLHLAVIVSTSVIALEPSVVSRPSTFSIADAFVSSPPNISVSALSGNALVRYFGINSRNLSYPTGTSANLTISNFVPSTMYAENSTFLATVPGISASLDCEPIPPTNLTDVTSQPWRSILAPVYTTNISVGSCNIIGVPIAMGLDHAPPIVNTLSSFQGWWNNYTCNDGINNAQYLEVDSPRYGYKPIVEGHDDHRLVFVTSFVQWTARDGLNVSRHTWVQNFTGIICKPRYSIDSYDVQLTPAKLHTKNPYQAQIIEGASHKIDGFADIDIAALIKRDSYHSLIVKSALKQNIIAVVTEDRGYLRREDPFFIVLSGNGDTSVLSNQTEMLRRVPVTFSGVASQAFQEYLTTPGGREIDGSVQVFANRLKAKALPVGFMLSLLGLLTIISIALIFLSPWDAVPSNPQSVAAKAKHLAASTSLSHHLRALNGLNMHQLQSALGGLRYTTILTPHTQDFVIVPESNLLVSEGATSERALVQEASNVWWKPLNHRLWFVLLIIISPLAVIAVLEVLQHISDTREGIRDVTDFGSRRILATLIPAAVLSIIAVSFQSMHFNACLTAPFNSLKHGGAPHQRGLTVSMLGKTSPHVLLLGLKRHLFLPCITALCVMVGAFLTIVVSGLYFVQDVPIREPVTLLRTDVFNFTIQDLSLSDNLAGVTTKLLLNENLPNPQWTYNDLVFPAVRTGETNLMINGSSIEVQLPAIRPRFYCFPNDVSDITYDEIITYSEGADPAAFYDTSFDFPCLTNSSICHSSWGFQQYVKADATNYILGGALDVTKGDCLGQSNSSDYVLQQGCPSLTFALGTTSLSPLNETAIRQTRPQLRAFLCNAFLQEVQTQVTLTLPEYAISNATGKTPMPIESTARNLTFSSPFYTGPIYTNALSTLISALDGDTIEVDPIMDAIIRGKDNGTATDLLGAEGATRLESRASALYAAYMVNAISSNFRIEPAQFNTQDSTQDQPPDMLPGTTYSGMLLQTNRQRLKQDRNTKIALQVMLGIMTLLAITVFLLTDRTLRLPTNPCSIAGTMSLLAGSEMASRNVVPQGSEWNDVDNRIWEGWLFSLGWWSDGQGKRFGIDIGNAGSGAPGGRGGLPSHYPPPPPPPLSSHSAQAHTSSAFDISRHRAYSAGSEHEEHEMKDLKPFTPVNVEVPSGAMGWNDNDYRYSLTTPPTTSRDNPGSRPPHQQRDIDPGDIGIARSTGPTTVEFDRLYDRYRSRVAKQYQTSR